MWLASATPAAPIVSNPAKAGTAYHFFMLIPSFDAPDNTRTIGAKLSSGSAAAISGAGLDCVTEGPSNALEFVPPTEPPG